MSAAAPPAVETQEPLVLVVDDDVASRKAMALTLQTDGRRVEEFSDADSALARAAEDPTVALVVTDLKMPGQNGTGPRDGARGRPAGRVRPLVRRHGTSTRSLPRAPLARSTTLPNRSQKDDLRLRAEAALKRSRQAGEIRDLRERSTSGRLRGDPRDQQAHGAALREAAASWRHEDDGSRHRRVRQGKELVANALHHNSPRRARAFRRPQLRRDPQEIIESELFGHERGAFTGALVKRVGRIEQAHGGTLFLDEVSEMPPTSRWKFLRVLEEKRVTPVGGNEGRDVDFA